MARPGVTYQDIAAAAHRIAGEGKNPTIENVRAILGTGSIGTINKYLRQWKETRHSTDTIASQEQLPEALVSVLKGLWVNVVEQASDHITVMEEKHKETLSAVQDTRDKYQKNNHRWQQLFQKWHEEKARLSQERETLEKKLHESQKQAAALSEQHAIALKQLEEKQERIGELHRLHQQTQENLEHYRESAREQRLLDQQSHEQYKQQTQTEIKALQEQFTAQREKTFSLQRQHQSLEQTYIALEKTHEQTQSQLHKLTTQIEESEKAKNEYWHASQHWRNQYQESQTLLNEKITFLVDTQTELKLLSRELSDIKKVLGKENILKKIAALENQSDQFGFKWENAAQIITQIRNELVEIHEHLNSTDPDVTLKLQEEIGDLLHAAFSLCHFCNVDFQETLEKSANKFERRFMAVQALAKERGLDNLHSLPFKELMNFWDKAKETVG